MTHRTSKWLIAGALVATAAFVTPGVAGATATPAPTPSGAGHRRLGPAQPTSDRGRSVRRPRRGRGRQRQRRRHRSTTSPAASAPRARPASATPARSPASSAPGRSIRLSARLFNGLLSAASPDGSNAVGHGRRDRSAASVSCRASSPRSRRAAPQAAGVAERPAREVHASSG